MKRGLLTILLFLLLGAVVNVAVAWGCSVWMDPWLSKADQRVGGDLRGDGYCCWIIWEHRRTGALRVVSQWYERGVALEGGFPQEPARPLVPAWAPIVSPDYAHLPRANHYCVATARGWPLLSLAGGLHLQQRARETVTADTFWSMAIDKDHVDHPSGHWELRLLPFRPLPAGFAINTLFYAVLLWLPGCGPFALRRWVRKRHGRCLKCGYPAGASEVCTECGATL